MNWSRFLLLSAFLIGLVVLFIVYVVPYCEGAEEGIASWYGGGEKLNKYTASGEVFSSERLTCAIWDVPFQTRLRITRLDTHASVIVRVNDRGPARRLGRLIDLTRAAFLKLAPLEKGLIKVRVEVISESNY